MMGKALPAGRHLRDHGERSNVRHPIRDVCSDSLASAQATHAQPCVPDVSVYQPAPLESTANLGRSTGVQVEPPLAPGISTPEPGISTVGPGMPTHELLIPTADPGIPAARPVLSTLAPGTSTVPPLVGTGHRSGERSSVPTSAATRMREFTVRARRRRNAPRSTKQRTIQ